MVSGKIEKDSRLKNFNPNDKIEIFSTVWEFLPNHRNQKRKGISLFYDLLSEYPLEYKSPHMIKWEKDLLQTYTGE